MIAEGVISWKSAKQTIIASSTMEAEFVACFEATVHGLWLRNFILGLGIVDFVSNRLRIYYDNSAVVFFSKNDKYSKGAKHMELKYRTVKEDVQKQRHLRNMSVEWILKITLDYCYFNEIRYFMLFMLFDTWRSQ